MPLIATHKLTLHSPADTTSLPSQRGGPWPLGVSVLVIAGLSGGLWLLIARALFWVFA